MYDLQHAHKSYFAGELSYNAFIMVIPMEKYLANVGKCGRQ